MNARWQCPFTSLLLLLLLPPALQEPAHGGGHISFGDEDRLSGKAKLPSVESYSSRERVPSVIDDFHFANERKALKIGVESSMTNEELPNFEDDLSGDALHPVFSSSGNQMLALEKIFRDKRSGEQQGDNTFKGFVSLPLELNTRSESVAAAPRQLLKRSASMTLQLCRSIYRSEYGEQVRNYAFVYIIEKQVLIMIVKKNFVDLCLPLFRVFEKCVERKFLTICPSVNLGFLHSHGCTRPSPQDKYFEMLLAFHHLEGDEECFQGICDGTYRFIESSIRGLTYQMFNIIGSGGKKLCFARPEFLSKLKNQTSYVVQNNERPCCYAMYLVAWLGRPEEHGLNGSWSFLPISCRFGEMMLILMVAGVAVSGVVGNLVVVAAMVSGSRLGQESSMLRTSLATADLLSGLIVVAPSFCYHLAPFFRPTEYEILKGHQKFSSSLRVQRDTHTTLLTNVLIYNEGFHVFQSLVHGTCSSVSLLTLLLLSAERAVMTGRSLRYKHYITKGRIKVIIVFTWILGVLETLLFHYNNDGSISSAWSTFSKIPKRTSYTNPTSLAYAFFTNIHVVIYMVAGIATVAFSVLAIRNFMREETRVGAEWKSLGMRTTEHYYQESHRILVTMVLMIVFYLISVTPITLLFILNIANYDFAEIYLFGYFSVWLFLASTAWNPWLYNMRSSQFTSDLAELMYKVLPSPLSEKFKPYITHSRINRWDNTRLTPASKSMLTKLGLTEK